MKRVKKRVGGSNLQLDCVRSGDDAQGKRLHCYTTECQTSTTARHVRIEIDVVVKSWVSSRRSLISSQAIVRMSLAKAVGLRSSSHITPPPSGQRHASVHLWNAAHGKAKP